MILDTHCHFDMMPNPEKYIKDAENRGDIVVGMTNLPSHFRMGINHVKCYNNIRLGLGFHPQLISEHMTELTIFESSVNQTSYIGEIGLDFSRDYIASKNIQLECLKRILSSICEKKKIVSVHSRKAEKELFTILKDFKIENVIFHWYSGPLNLIDDIVNEGYYFSINEAMTLSESGRRIISKIPTDRILTESDAPYNNKNNIHNALRNIGFSESLIQSNFNTLIKRIK